MSKANLRALVRFRMEQAEESLRAALLLREQKAPREVVNRAYYAMFYAVLALLATRRGETSKHKGAITLFDRDFVKSGVFTKDLSRWLHETFNLRLASDYAPFFQPAQEEAEESLERAKTFVSAVKAYLAEFLKPANDADSGGHT